MKKHHREHQEVTRPRMRVRSKALLLLALGAFVGMVYAYGQIELGLPQPQEEASTLVRGRILTEDGLVLAQTVAGRRQYPQGALAGQLIGFMGKEGGLEGLEQQFEAQLSAGQDLTLTLDPAFQAAAESLLAQHTKRHGGLWGSLVALDVQSGKVLAVANYPSFDPTPDRWDTNKWGEVRPVHERLDPVATRNHALLDSFEPGSVVKALTVGALLNDAAVSLEQFFPTPMARRVGRTIINDVVDRPPGEDSLNVQGILRYSSNVGMSHLVEDYPPERLHAYFAAYGLGQPLALGGVLAAQGQLNPWQRWGEVGRVTNSFGQGLSSTTLQLVAAYNVLARDGVYVEPQLALEPGQTFTPKLSHRVLRPETAQTLRTLLEYIVEEGIPGQAGVEGYGIGGKTGTAQVVVNGKYSNDIFNSVFSGIFPLEKPRVSMVVMVHGAKRDYHGSQLAAPIFRDVAAEMMARWGMTPQRIAETKPE